MGQAIFWTMFFEEKNLFLINVTICQKSSKKALIRPKRAN